MQKRIKIIVVLLILIIFIISMIVENSNFDNKKTFKKDGVLYAISVDGVSSTSFPTKGLYKVSVICENADGKWLYDDWKLSIENITGNVSCNIDFATIEKTYLNSYITGLSGTTQGNGQLIGETARIPNYSSTTVIAQSAYTNQSTFSSSSYADTSGTTVSGMYTFSNNQWTSNSSSMTSGKYYHFKFTPSESGVYQLCYNLSSGSTYNKVYAYVNSIIRYFGTSSSLSASSSEAKSDCIGLGYVSTSDYIKVTQYAYTTISTLSFSIKKGTYTTQDAGIRYEGKNPNNYVWFNNEYWRVIGVFDSNSHGQSGKNLVKIIRAEIFDGLAWHKSNSNDWTTSSLNLLLNDNYYNATDGTNSGNCYGLYSTATATGNCDYTKRGIQSGYRSMIANVTWYLGASPSNQETTETFYLYERGTKVNSGRPTSDTGYIGLMYPSDYGYSVLSSNCARTTGLISYGSSSCAGKSWLYGKGSEWVLSPTLDSSFSYFVFYVGFSGSLSRYSSTDGHVVRPVLYLDESVYVIDGEGTLDKPYIIGM